MPTESQTVPVGLQLPAVDLPTIDEGRWSPQEPGSSAGVLVAFVCNHCPYVQHVEEEFGRLAQEAIDTGFDVVAVCSNDADAYPDDDVDGLRAQVKRTGWSIPYAVDADQSFARALGAECTPDFFLFDADQRLVWRGAMDMSSPSNDHPVDGHLLRGALETVRSGEQVGAPERPSIGCSIKWRQPR